MHRDPDALIAADARGERDLAAEREALDRGGAVRPPHGRRANAYVRVRAWKSRLLGRLEVTPLMLATDATAMQRAVTALGIESPFDRLVRIYGLALRGYPDAAPLFLGLLRLHEIENVKLLWRVVARGRDRKQARRLWIPLGKLATVSSDALDAIHVRDLIERLAPTPFAAIATDVARAGDSMTAELAFDRWASLQLLMAARGLPRTERLARKLIELVVRERDSEIIRRGERWFGLSASAARAATALRAAAWPPHSRLDPAEFRAARLRLCRRAFVGNPFAIAPALALVLLAEEELRAVRALIERQGDKTLDAAAARASAGAQWA